MARRNQRKSQGDGIVTGLIYTRVSTSEQAKEGLSLPAQLKECRRYCADRGWIIAGEYEDVLSGRRDDRPQYQTLLIEARRLAREGKTVAVIVMRLDRLGRRLKERVDTREEFKKAGIQTHSVREGGEVNDMMATMLASMAEQEVERLADRVADTRDHNRENGWHCPGRPAWGFKLRPATEGERRQGAPRSVIVPDEVTAPFARQMFEMVAQGASPRAAALWVAGLPDEARGGRLLAQAGVRLLLKAPVYVGRFEPEDGQEGKRGNWESLVSEETWQAVQARLGTGKKRSGPVSDAHLLTGMIVCPRCGSRMAGWTQGGRWKRYRCNSFEHGGERARRNCTTTISAEPVDASVIEQVTATLAPLAATDVRIKRATARAWEELRRPNDEAAKTQARAVAQARRDAEAAKRRIGDAARLLVDGTIDRVAYEALAGAEQRRLEAAERTLAAPEIVASAADQLPPLADALALFGDWERVLGAGPVPDRRALLAALIQTVTSERISHGKYRAHIVWTPLGTALDAIREGAATAA